MSPTAFTRLFRALVVFELISTVAGAVLAFVAPEFVIGPLIAGDISPQARAVTAQAGASWFALGLLLLATLRLRPGDARVLRLILVPVLAGDVVHAAAVALLVTAHGRWTGGVIGLNALTLFLFSYRVLILMRPERLLGVALAEPGTVA
jgi:hypothetical protein